MLGAKLASDPGGRAQKKSLPNCNDAAQLIKTGMGRPADFANASPFPSRKKTKDPARPAILAAVAVAFVAFLASLIALFLMQPPSF
jgi:hypothetical protein